MINVLNNTNINNDANGPYVYLVNAALVFVVLYGYYTLNDIEYYYETKSLVCGETATISFPPGSREITIRVDASYIFWANIYDNFSVFPRPNVCLLTTGFLFETRCDEISCSSTTPAPSIPPGPLTGRSNCSNLMYTNQNNNFLCNTNYKPPRCENSFPHKIIYASANDFSYVTSLHKNCNNTFML